MEHPLDNPAWLALNSTHAAFARGDAHLKRYDPAVAPFCAVARPGVAMGQTALVEVGEAVCFVGAIPTFGDRWKVEREATIVQMVYDGKATTVDATVEMCELAGDDVPDMIALTTLVYPAYFRVGTIRLGRYLGVRVDGQLVAMAGERMAPAGYREISGVCTHPAFTGRGLAASLCSRLIEGIVERGEIPFLHFDETNARAQQLYERLGFSKRGGLSLAACRRV